MMNYFDMKIENNALKSLFEIWNLSKSGKKGVRSIRKILPEFPAREKQIMAGAFHNNQIYLFDSSEGEGQPHFYMNLLMYYFYCSWFLNVRPLSI